MRKQILTAVGCLALASAAIGLAQGRGGGAGSGPGGGMGAGPPITPPGQMGGGMSTRDAARGIADQRGQFGRDFAIQQHLTADELRAQATQHRADAMAMAQAVRSGTDLPDSAASRIRAAMKDDIEAWREEFRVGRQDWQAMRDQWLLDRSSLTAEQWAMRRADWFAARDAWVAAQKSTAMARRGN
jgi:hypothetical protein